MDNWTIKEVALKLGISERTIQDWCKKNNTQTQSIADGMKPVYILSQKDIERIIVDVPKVASEAKEELTKEYIEKGIVIQKTTDTAILESQHQLIGNLILAKKKHELMILDLKNETSAMRLELDDHKEEFRTHVDKEKIDDNTVNIIRDLIHAIFEITGKSVWHELHQEFHFSKLAKITEIKGQLIIEYLKKKYGY